MIAAPRFDPGLPLRLLGCASGIIALWLLAKSVFLEPWQARRRGKGSLTRDGTYALSRHPGVLWLFLLLSSLVLASGSLLLLEALPAWTIANLLAALAEDRLFFPKLFGSAYLEYAAEVPFLLPTRESLARFLRRRDADQRKEPQNRK